MPNTINVETGINATKNTMNAVGDGQLKSVSYYQTRKNMIVDTEPNLATNTSINTSLEKF